MSQSDTPAKVGSMEGLGLPAIAPRPRAWAIFTDSGNARLWGTKQPHLQMLADEAGHELTPLFDQAALDAAVAAERERCAAWVQARRDAFCEEFGYIDPDTGALEFGHGASSVAKSEYVGELEEIADGLRALKA